MTSQNQNAGGLGQSKPRPLHADAGRLARILTVDDTRAIHDDFRKILGGADVSEFDMEEADFFQTEPVMALGRAFEFSSAY